MTGYDSYLAGRAPAPKYTREVWPAWSDLPLFPWLRLRGVLVEKDHRGYNNSLKRFAKWDGEKFVPCDKFGREIESEE